MKDKISYVFLMYDIADEESETGKNRVNKVFKICKKYLNHHQKSVFRGEITPSNLLKLKKELKNVIDNTSDFVTIIKFKNKNQFSEEELGGSKDEYFL